MLPLVLSLVASLPEAAVGGLTAEDFAAREAAHVALLVWGDAAVPTLRRHREHADLEARRHVAVLLASARGRLLERLGTVPEIDGLWYCPLDLWGLIEPGYQACPVAEALRPYLDRAGGGDDYPYRHYVAALRLLLDELIDAEFPEIGLHLLLAAARRGDAAFLERNHGEKDWRADVWGETRQ